MTFRRFILVLRLSAVVLLVTGAFCPALHAQALDQTLLAQGPLPDAPTPFVEAASPAFVTPSIGSSEHKFWDKQNRVLLITAAALNGADFAVTRANLQSGGQELNPLVRIFGRSTAGLAANFIGETAGVVGLSYFFHKTGHHKLERAVSLVNIGSSAGAVAFGLTHR
jgi:hypothetical protein